MLKVRLKSIYIYNIVFLYDNYNKHIKKFNICYYYL